MGITTKTSRNLTANAAIAIKNVGHAHREDIELAARRFAQIGN
jgi:hypothetical protein